MKLVVPLLMAVAIGCGATAAHATDPCTGTVLRDFSPQSYPKNKDFVARKHYKIQRITQYTIKDGVKVFCAHGDICYPRSFVKLNNCAINFRRPDRTSDVPIYGLKIIRSRFSAKELRRLDLEDALYQYGISENRIEQYGDAFARHPHGECGRLARGALSGNRRAIEALKKEVDANGNAVNPCIQESSI